MSKQNVYDNNVFFENFQSSRSNDVNFNDCIETPILFGMLPDLHGKRILDIGCGMGQHAKQYSDMGADTVLGLDISAKMLDYAKEHNNNRNIIYRQMAMEDIDTINETFDLVTSSLAFDYVEDFPGLMEKIHNLMEKDKMSSNQRYFALMKQRLEALNQAELEMLVNSTVAVRRQLVLLAICKAHPFIYDFISENVRDCFYNQYEKVTHANFNEFYNEKKYEHPELEQVSEDTVYKMRQVTFRILEQTELIEDINSGILRRPYLSEAIERIVVQDDPKWLAIYLYSDNEINNLRDLYA